MKGQSAFIIALLGVLVSHCGQVQGGVLPPEPPDTPNWNNDPEGPVVVDCDCGYALHKVRSQYSAPDFDRQWLWECIKISDHENVKTKCEWYNFINDELTPIVFRCPRKQYMAGIRSNFFIDDRIWDVKCCKSVDICPNDCYLSYCINDLQEDINFCSKENGLFVGIYSDYDPDLLDRTWKIEQCQASKCSLFAGVRLDYFKRSHDDDEKEKEEEEEEEKEK